MGLARPAAQPRIQTKPVLLNDFLEARTGWMLFGSSWTQGICRHTRRSRSPKRNA